MIQISKYGIKRLLKHDAGKLTENLKVQKQKHQEATGRGKQEKKQTNPQRTKGQYVHRRVIKWGPLGEDEAQVMRITTDKTKEAKLETTSHKIKQEATNY